MIRKSSPTGSLLPAMILLCMNLSAGSVGFAQTWSAVGSGTNSTVVALTTYNSELYAGGYFTTAGGAAANYIAKWNGTGWSSFGGNTVNGRVLALAVYNGELYVGGEFTNVDGGSAENYIAKWNGTAWSKVGTAMNARVRMLYVFNSALYAGGDFTSAGGTAVSYIAKWNGTSWSSMGTGTGYTIQSIADYNGDLYAGGYTSGSNPLISRWNGTSWSSLGTGITGSGVQALMSYNGYLYVGGSFSAAGGVAGTGFLARWDGTNWSSAGGGVNGNVWGFLVTGNKLYVSGTFTTAGSVSASRVVTWDGSSWSAIGSGVDNNAMPLALYNSELYIGGAFSNAGGITATNIARIALSPLPVELISFKALPNDEQQVFLEWETVTEINNDYFNIEKSSDSRSWESIGTVKAEGNTNQTRSYSMIDPSPFSGLSYYRLKQVDLNGKFEYFGPVAVNLKGMEILKAYPNPAEDQLQFNVISSLNDRISVNVMDVVGRKVNAFQQEITAGANTIVADVSAFPRGMYLLQLITESGKFSAQKQFMVN